MGSPEIDQKSLETGFREQLHSGKLQFLLGSRQMLKCKIERALSNLSTAPCFPSCFTYIGANTFEVMEGSSVREGSSATSQQQTYRYLLLSDETLHQKMSLSLTQIFFI